MHEKVPSKRKHAASAPSCFLSFPKPDKTYSRADLWKNNWFFRLYCSVKNPREIPGIKGTPAVVSVGCIGIQHVQKAGVDRISVVMNECGEKKMLRSSVGGIWFTKWSIGGGSDSAGYATQRGRQIRKWILLYPATFGRRDEYLLWIYWRHGYMSIGTESLLVIAVPTVLHLHNHCKYVYSHIDGL